MANIQLQRSSEFANRAIDFQILIDGKNIGIIANGEIKDFPVNPGQHKLIAKIDWCSSEVINFNVKETEVKNFHVAGIKNQKWILFILFGSLAIGYIGNQFIENGIGMLFFLPAIVMLFYYQTFGRKKYLTLKEIQ